MSELLKVRTDDFRKLGPQLVAADRATVLALRRQLRAIAKPAGQKILEAYGVEMPQRGGFADRVRSLGRVSVLTNLKQGVRIQLSNRGGVWMGGPEAGLLRHPVWGRRGKWTTTKVPAGVGAKTFEADADQMRDRVVEATTGALRKELA